MINVIDDIDIDTVVKQYLMIEGQIQWVDMPPWRKQASLQYAEESENLWAGGTGKLSGTEHQYKNLNPLLQGTIFEDIINEYKLVYSKLKPKASALYALSSKRFRLHFQRLRTL